MAASAATGRPTERQPDGLPERPGAARFECGEAPTTSAARTRYMYVVPREEPRVGERGCGAGQCLHERELRAADALAALHPDRGLVGGGVGPGQGRSTSATPRSPPDWWAPGATRAATSIWTMRGTLFSPQAIGHHQRREYVPGVVYVCVTNAPLPTLPSPNDQSHVTRGLGPREPLPSNVTTSGAVLVTGVAVTIATGSSGPKSNAPRCPRSHRGAASSHWW